MKKCAKTTFTRFWNDKNWAQTCIQKTSHFSKYHNKKFQKNQKDLHNIEQHCHNYCFEKWSTHIERFSTFPLPNLAMSWYFYHQRWLSNFNKHCHIWIDSPKYDTTCMVHNNACNNSASNDSCHLRKDTIIPITHIERLFHSLYHRRLWLFSFSFQLFFNYLCSYH